MGETSDKAALEIAKACMASLSTMLTFPVSLLLVALVTLLHTEKGEVQSATIDVFGVSLAKGQALGLIIVVTTVVILHAARQVVMVRQLRTSVSAGFQEEFDFQIEHLSFIFNPFARRLIDPASRTTVGPAAQSERLTGVAGALSRSSVCMRYLRAIRAKAAAFTAKWSMSLPQFMFSVLIGSVSVVAALGPTAARYGPPLSYIGGPLTAAATVLQVVVGLLLHDLDRSRDHGAMYGMTLWIMFAIIAGFQWA